MELNISEMKVMLDAQKDVIDRQNKKMAHLYKNGFLDGMRYAGKLLIDVENKDLKVNTLTKDIIHTLEKKRAYYEV